MQDAIAVIVGTFIVLGLLGSMILALLHGFGFSMLLKQKKPKFLPRVTIQILSAILCGIVSWVLYSPKSISQAIGLMLAIPVVQGALYILITTALTRAWFNMDWRSAAKSLRIIHVLCAIWTMIWFGLTVAAVASYTTAGQ